MNYTIITGATGVLGKCFCKKYAKLGNNLIITARNIDKLKHLQQELQNEFNVKVQICVCELSLQASRKQLFDFLDGYGEISRLVLVAGNDNQKAFSLYTQEKIIEQIRANFESQVCLSSYCLSKMETGGELLVISSLTAIVPMPYFAIYSACKRAQLDFFRAIKREYNNVKITVALPSSMPTRQDVIEDIKKQGLTGKLASVSPEKVVDVCVKKVGKNKDIVVIGFYNKLVYFFNKITPLKLQQKIIEKKFKNKRKENF